MKYYIVILVILFLLYAILFTSKEPLCKKDIWIGGPVSHVPMPMARWNYEGF